MADCVALRQSSGYNDISIEIKNFLPKLPPLFPITSLQQYNSTKQAINNERGKVQNLKSKLDAAVAQLEAGGCSARSVGAGAPYGAIERLERELDLNTQTVEREWERTQEAQAATAQQAAATQNNAGNGTPGSAASAATGATGATGTPSTGATGPSTPQGTETSGATGATGPVVGSTKPATPQGVGATGASGASGAVGAGTLGAAAASGATGASVPGASGAAPSNRSALKQEARVQQAVGEAVNIASKGDWRVRLSLANKANYFYNADSKTILAPLKVTNGIVFPYTPTISVNYSAKYDSNNPAHSNYNISQYQYSQVEDVTIGCEFTAQSTDEANYVLAVIHFLRSATKMFYGKDTDPIAGTPPPLVYLTGLGQYQFNGHPLVITGFTYSLPNDVDYIRTGIVNIPSGTGQTGGQAGSGGNPTPPQFNSEDKPTYIPTKISIQIRCLPIVARNVISNEFSLKKYASGELLLGKNNTTGGGIW